MLVKILIDSCKIYFYFRFLDKVASFYLFLVFFQCVLNSWFCFSAISKLTLSKRKMRTTFHAIEMYNSKGVVFLCVQTLCKDGLLPRAWHAKLDNLRDAKVKLSLWKCPYIHGVTFKLQYSVVALLGPTPSFIMFNNLFGSIVEKSCRSFSSFLHKQQILFTAIS